MAGIAATLVVGAFLYFVIAQDSDRFTNWEDNGVDIKSLIEAANNGIPAAQFSLGIAYHDGNQVEADPSEAFRWFQQSAEQGHAQAQLAVALDYLRDEGGAALDFKQAVLWLRQAEAQDNLDARANLGWCYANGFGVTQNLERAETLIHDAAEKGNFLALSGMAQLYSGEVEGIEPDPEKYFYWTQKSAELGDRAGQYYMGCCFISGQGTPVDKENGWGWIERSAEQGFEPALAALQDRREQSAINEMQYRLQQQIERNMQQRPQGANPFSAHPSSQRVPPQYREAERRAYGDFR